MTERERRELKRRIREARARRPRPEELVPAELRFDRCVGVTLRNERCPYAAQESSKYCFIHEPVTHLVRPPLERLRDPLAKEGSS